MKFIKQKIQGVYLIKPVLHEDERGVFRRSYCEDELSSIGIKFTVKQGNISENFKKHTLRGFHYQVKPFEEKKILACLQGFLYVVIVDLRSDSSKFLKYIS